MRKQLLLTLSILAIAFLFVTGCEKEEDPAPAKTKTQLISQSSWKLITQLPPERISLAS
ncbi:MAG: hypothetical protein WDO71_17490 [Bacteroidota bacterium]